jgi:hypothetical protein
MSRTRPLPHEEEALTHNCPTCGARKGDWCQKIHGIGYVETLHTLRFGVVIE